MEEMNHRNLAKVYSHFLDNDKLDERMYLLIEKYDMSLIDYLKKNTGKISIMMKINISLDISLGIKYLHENKIIHRDIELENILLKIDNSNKIKEIVLSGLKSIY